MDHGRSRRRDQHHGHSSRKSNDRHRERQPSPNRPAECRGREMVPFVRRPTPPPPTPNNAASAFARLGPPTSIVGVIPPMQPEPQSAATATCGGDQTRWEDFAGPSKPAAPTQIPPGSCSCNQQQHAGPVIQVTQNNSTSQGNFGFAQMAEAFAAGRGPAPEVFYQSLAASESRRIRNAEKRMRQGIAKSIAKYGSGPSGYMS
jgi:hypothetical protein